MKDENGDKLGDDDLIKIALGHLAEACVFLFETEDREGHALAFMVDMALKYGQVVVRGDHVLTAAADYTKYEESRVSRECNIGGLWPKG